MDMGYIKKFHTLYGTCIHIHVYVYTKKAEIIDTVT